MQLYTEGEQTDAIGKLPLKIIFLRSFEFVAIVLEFRQEPHTLLRKCMSLAGH